MKVPTIALLSLPFVGAVAGPAAAAEPDLYVSIAGSYSLLNDAHFELENTPVAGVSTVKTNRIKNGWGAAGAVGHRFGALRVEGELGFTHNGRTSYKVLAPPPVAGRVIKDSGHQDSLRLMANAFVEGHLGSFRPYAGAGVGAARLRSKSVAARAPFPTETPQELWDDKDWRFAYQLIGGAELRTGGRASFFAQYRWFDAGTMAGRDPRGERFTHEHRGHNVDVGVRFGF